MEEIEDEVFNEEEESCFGEYGNYPDCSTCRFKDSCKRFAEAEQEVAMRHKGKYGSTGKEKRKDKY